MEPSILSTRTTIELPSRLRSRLEAWASSRYPIEACGFLFGRRVGPRVQVAGVREAPNHATERPHDRYEIDPANHLQAEELARAVGLEVVGVWHSHPDHTAVPSEVDRERAWEGWSYVIVSCDAEARGELRSWHLIGESFEEEEVRS